MKITKEKRPDKITCKWDNFEVAQDPEGKIDIWKRYGHYTSSLVSLERNEVEKLIIALQKVLHESTL